MIKTEIAEIKKLFKLNNCSVTRICGCYVDGEKNIKEQWERSFLSLDEEDMLKYLDLFRKCFSGGMEKNLINTAIAGTGVKESFLELRDTRLQNPAVREAFYERIIDTYEYVGNYLILMIHDVYDVPGKTSDGIEMEDASDSVYEYILACICPVNLSKPGLGYNQEEGSFTHIERDWVLRDPQLAVLYPAFNDREADEDAALVYAKNLHDPDKEFLSRLLGCNMGLSHTQEREVFTAILEETLGAAQLKEVSAVQQTLIRMAAEHSLDPEPYKLDKAAVEKIFRESGISADKMQRFHESYHGNVEKDSEIVLDNIVNRRSFTVETDAGRISVKPEYAEEISIREIDGQKCLVMNIIGGVWANGIFVDTGE